MLPKEPPPKGRKLPQRGGRRFGYGPMDLFVVATCSLAFAIVIGPGRHVASPGPPVGPIAQELGTTPEELQRAADKFVPPFRIGPPTETQKRQVAATLNVSRATGYGHEK